MIFPEMDVEAGVLTFKGVKCEHPHQMHQYRLGVADYFGIEGEGNRLDFINHPVVTLAGILVDWGYPSTYAARLVLKAGAEWPLVQPDWYGPGGERQFWDRIEVKQREFCATARIKSMRQGVALVSTWCGPDTATLPLPGLWADATLYLCGLLVMCSDKEMSQQMSFGI